MIVSASYRTDIPAFYSRWFLNRLANGGCRVANPYGGPDYRVSLEPRSVDGFVFWTRNPAPFAEALGIVRERGNPFIVQQTVTGYPRGLDLATPLAADGIKALRQISQDYGRRAAVWRYDPIVITDATSVAWHRENFAGLATGLAGAVDEVVVSFLQVYRKTRHNLNQAAARQGFAWRDPDDGEKRDLLAELAIIAADRDIRLTLCGQPQLLGQGIGEARCIDAARLSDIAGRDIVAANKPHRKGCACARSLDIGAYDSCPHGCVYCYAVGNRETAKRHLTEIDFEADSLSSRRATQG